ncbi:DUF4334 domain-containing protein [Parafrankia sp. EUN1f]|uniref:DUF4334 domain-containing protein n=1 Tax=Parafrankia sp. EUN1f TaxID=102897 RepID=UPI0001C45A2C|nr:DUF4334 domain-containing protein [Parafrankia sp. EUN1f]EFC83625.1 conserved hypothetical protein [Parafrankia sp. EUN1f]
MKLTSSAAAILELIRTGANESAEPLLALFDELDPVPATFMYGRWRGGLLTADRELGVLLTRMKWYGRHFTDAEHADPLLCRRSDGTLYSFAGLGLARLRELSFRGKVSAAMIYDDQPMIDVFRKISENVVLGVTDTKGRPADFFFHLTRD